MSGFSKRLKSMTSVDLSEIVLGKVVRIKLLNSLKERKGNGLSLIGLAYALGIKLRMIRKGIQTEHAESKVQTQSIII